MSQVERPKKAWYLNHFWNIPVQALKVPSQPADGTSELLQEALSFHSSSINELALRKQELSLCGSQGLYKNIIWGME